MSANSLDGDFERLLETEEVQGERRANMVRLLVASLFLVAFVVVFLTSESHYRASYVILADLVVFLIYSVALWRILARGFYHPALKYLSSAADTTWVTVMVIASLSFSRNLELQGWIAYIAVFLLFIALTGLRFNPALSLVTGIITSGQFLLLNFSVSMAGGQPLPSPQLASVALLLFSVGGVVAITMRMVRQLALRASMAERQRAQLAFEADHAFQLAITDELTGLHNRRHFMAELRRELARSSRYQRPFAVLLIDMDYFKQVNDALGHLAGDMALKQLATILRTKSRETDVVARYGGDEFSLILCETDPEQAETAAERLCEAVRKHKFLLEDGIHYFHVSLSIGLARFPFDAADVEGLLKAADRAVYQAKALGRDRVVCAERAER